MNINDSELQILQLLLGGNIIEEFLGYVANNHQTIPTINYRPTQQYVVDVSNFSKKDLVGYWDYDECYYDDKMFIEPSWLIGLRVQCRSNPNQRYTVVFKGADNANDTIHRMLENLNSTGYLTSDFSLPGNAQYGQVEIHPRQIHYGQHKYDPNDPAFPEYDKLR